jgi:hypothetical protein
MLWIMVLFCLWETTHAWKRLAAMPWRHEQIISISVIISSDCSVLHASNPFISFCIQVEIKSVNSMMKTNSELESLKYICARDVLCNTCMYLTAQANPWPNQGERERMQWVVSIVVSPACGILFGILSYLMIHSFVLINNMWILKSYALRHTFMLLFVFLPFSHSVGSCIAFWVAIFQILPVL